MKKIVLAGIILGTLLGCSKMPFVYRPDIQQGNIISQEAVQQLKPGMPADQVRYLMGNPVLVNALDSNRWDYVYTYQPGKGEMKVQRVIVHFQNGVLKNYTKR